ncbi:thioredoxin domain-containing protein [Candidatus Woesearchaeota archaeon]|nr:thioredoxin domain-containing protein [Candidatus Woesearchaeota archaeon]
MVLCIVALPVFAILGIFSLRYRKLAVESLHCLFRTAIFRPCRSGLDENIKSSITGKVMKYSPKAAGAMYRHYRILSLLFLIVLLLSAYWTAAGVYNYWKYGNCNGPEETGFCMFDPAGENSRISETDVDSITQVVIPKVENGDPLIGNPNAEITIIEFGCYACPFTKKAEPIINEVLEHYKGKVNLQFRTFYIPNHNLSYTSALAANCAMEQGKYLEYHKKLFEMQESMAKDKLFAIADSIGLEQKNFTLCMESNRYRQEIDSDSLAGIHGGVRGTPTFFINSQRIAGPKPFRTFKTIIDSELKK